MTAETPYSPPPPPAVYWRLPASSPLVSIGVIVACVLVFLMQVITERLTGYDLPAAYGAKINELIIAGQVWRLITPVFLHGSLMHIGFNMYALYVIGREMERFYGHARYALLMLVSGFAGNVVSFLFQTSPSLGASTAVFGLIAAEGVFFYKNRQLFRNARSILMNTVLIIVINMFIGLSPGIDYWGHIGGLLGGLMFSALAGPVWLPNLRLDGVHITNQVGQNRVLGVTLAVGGLFAFLAALKILGLV